MSADTASALAIIIAGLVGFVCGQTYGLRSMRDAVQSDRRNGVSCEEIVRTLEEWKG